MRADVYLVSFGFADSRQRASRLIKSGSVKVDGKCIERPSENIDEGTEHSVLLELSEEDGFVSRGALKLRAALDHFGISAEGKLCADIGASTGGFTDCLLQRGAAKVYAFDSGRGQLHPRLASDTRVISREGFNARYITTDDIGGCVDMAVMDVSFISQTLILPGLSKIIADGGVLISLIKPQFEVGREAIGKNGIVKKWEARLAAAQKVMSSALSCGLCPKGFMMSPIKGGDGNEEYLAYFVKNAFCDPNETIGLEGIVKAMIKESARKE